MKFEELWFFHQNLLAKQPIDIELLKYQTFYAPEEYCDCGSSTCDICNPDWETEEFLEEIDCQDGDVW